MPAWRPALHPIPASDSDSVSGLLGTTLSRVLHEDLDVLEVDLDVLAAVQLERACPTVQILPASCQSPDALADVTSATSVPGSIIGILATGR